MEQRIEDVPFSKGSIEEYIEAIVISINEFFIGSMF